MWRFFAAEYSYCKELVDFFRLRKRMSEPHFQIFTGNTQDGTDIELIITGASGVKAAMAAGYVMAGKRVGDDDVCVCVEPSLSIEASTVKEKSAICVEIYVLFMIMRSTAHIVSFLRHCMRALYVFLSSISLYFLSVPMGGVEALLIS